MSGSLKLPMSSVDFNSDINELTVKEEINSDEDEPGVKFIPDIHTTQTSIYHLVPDVEIKAEEMDFHHNHNSTTDPDSENQFDLDREIVSSIPHFDFVSVKAEQDDLNEFYADVVQCQRDCGTCKKYMRLLSEHVKSNHCPSRPTEDPLQIDPLNLDPDLPHNHQSSSSSIQIKCEVDGSIDKVVCSEEDLKLNPESGQNFESENEHDSNCKVSPHMTRHVRRQALAKNKASSPSKHSKAKNSTMSSTKQFKRTSEIEHENDSSYNVSSRVTRNLCRRGLNTNNASSDSKTPMSNEPSRKEFKCDECDKTFSTKAMLGKHRRIHAGVKPFKCDECEKSFLQKINLLTHMRIHTGERPYHCDVCEKSYARSDHLTKHMRTHTGEKPYKCDACAKSFTNSSLLSVHKRTHTGEKPYKCDVCEKSFLRSSNLSRHILIHTGEKPYQCEECGKRFNQAGSLYSHKRMHTVRERLFKCDLCVKSFERHADLIEHKMRLHKRGESGQV